MTPGHAAEDRRAGEAGFALLTAILFLMIVTAAIVPFVLAARTRFDLAADTMRKERLDVLAEGLATVIARNLAAPPTASGGVSLRSIPASCRLGSLAIEARVQDQRGTIDLNRAEPGLLAAGLRALGLGGAAAEQHARAVVAYRQPAAPEDGGMSATPLEEAADESLAQDGFKHAPFEAIEELYDFRALQGVPLRALAEAFTVHAQQADILGPRMSGRLAAVLPEAPTPAQPFVADEVGGPASFRIDVFVRDADATLGYAGAIVVAPGTEDGAFALVQRTVNPNVLPGRPPAPPAPMSCDRLLGAPAVAALRGFAG